MRATFKRPLLILAITAAICSRTVLALFDDPEGPNLLVVGVLAAVIFVISIAPYLSRALPTLTGSARIAAAVVFQVIVSAGLFLAFR